MRLHEEFQHIVDLHHFIPIIKADIDRPLYSRTSYRNGRNTEALIIENLEPVEITKKLFQHHLNILKNFHLNQNLTWDCLLSSVFLPEFD